MENNQKVHVTRKKKKLVLLPAIKNYVYQPNRVTNAVYDYSLIQERLFNAVMFYLQGNIKERMSGVQYQQLSLFRKAPNNDVYTLNIPLKEISTPQNYEHVKSSIKQLASVVVEIPFVDESTKKEMMRYTGLIRANLPKDGERTSFIEIEIEKRVAKLLIEIDLNKNGQPVNYTRFVYEIAQNATSKYTSRIYKLICSWKKKGGFTMSLDEFRQWLGIEEKYKYYNDIRKHILVPVQEELFEKADCWFNCSDKDFAIKNGNSVTHLNFKVITPELIEDAGKKVDYIINLLKTYFYFTDANIDEIRGVLDAAVIQALLTKVLFLKEHIDTNRTKITDIPRYVIKTLLNEFGPSQN
jgi:Initiator Replication protein